MSTSHAISQSKMENHGENHLIISDLAIPKLNHLSLKWSVISSCPLTHLTIPPWHLKVVREPRPLSGHEFLLWLWLRLPRSDDSKHSLKLISASRDPVTSFSSSFDLTVVKTQMKWIENINLYKYVYVRINFKHFVPNKYWAFFNFK